MTDAVGNPGSRRPVVVMAMHDGLDRFAFRDEHRARLEQVAELASETALTEFASDEAGNQLARAEVLLTHWGCPRIDAAVLELAPRLALVAHAAGTVKGIVDPVVWERGITVTSAAAANAVPVAEFTLAMILLANKDAFGARERLRAGNTAHPWFDRSWRVGNLGKRVGIIGASLVGRKLIELLRPFSLDVLVYDPYLDADEASALGVTKVDLSELLSRSHVVSVHAPELPSTRHMIGASELALLRDGTVLINTARGSLVDHQALIAELRTGRIEAILDVTDPEPLPPDSPLLELPNVFVTPHIAGSAGTELRRLADLAVSEIERFARGEPPLHPVRLEDLDRIA